MRCADSLALCALALWHLQPTATTGMAYEVRFAESARSHLKALTSRQRRKAIEAIEAQLTHEPSNETRNRKPLRPNPLAPWELRIGNLRVFYDVDDNEPKSVNIVAVGEKRGNRLLVGGKEIKL